MPHRSRRVLAVSAPKRQRKNISEYHEFAIFLESTILYRFLYSFALRVYRKRFVASRGFPQKTLKILRLSVSAGVFCSFPLTNCGVSDGRMVPKERQNRARLMRGNEQRLVLGFHQMFFETSDCGTEYSHGETGGAEHEGV